MDICNISYISGIEGMGNKGNSTFFFFFLLIFEGETIHENNSEETMMRILWVCYLSITCVGLGAFNLLPLVPHSDFNSSKSTRWLSVCFFAPPVKIT